MFLFCLFRVVILLLDDNPELYETSQDVQVIQTFDAMGLKEDLLRGIFAYGT